MGIFRKFARRFGFVHRNEVRRALQRAYAAAGNGRLLGDWVASSTTADADIRSALSKIRARARDMAQNNDLMKAYLRAIKKNVVGASGFTLQVKAMNQVGDQMMLDLADSNYIERVFNVWASPQYTTVTGRMSWRKLQELVMETVARDGEIFVHMIRGAKVNQFGFTLQLIEPDWVDEKRNEGPLNNGNYIVMGVEKTPYGMPVAYHVNQQNSSTLIYGISILGPEYRRIPAEDMIHVFDPERASQTRGIPWMHSGMVTNRHLSGYIEAAVVNARASACKMGFFRDPEGDSGEYQGDEVDTSGNKIVVAEPGTFEDIGKREFVQYDPKYPDQQFDPFTKSMIRFIASGLGVSYQTLSGDLSDTSYSSGRQGLLEERETYKSIQSFFVETFLNRVYNQWLYMAILTGQLQLPISKFAKFDSPKWTGRRWTWVDPLDDTNSAILMIGHGLKSMTETIAEMGGDFNDTMMAIAAEKEAMNEMGLFFDYSRAKTIPVIDDSFSLQTIKRKKANGGRHDNA